MALDQDVSRAVFAASQVERALHDDRTWSIHWNGRVLHPVKHVREHSVEFYGAFGEHCHLVEPPTTVELRCAGEVVSVREIEFPGDGAFEISWRFSVADTPVAV